MLHLTIPDAEELCTWRRALHSHAEPGYVEFWTTAFLAEQLQNTNVQVRFGTEVTDRSAMLGTPDATKLAQWRTVALEQGADALIIERIADITGLVVDIRPAHLASDIPPRTLFRFDIDAVEVNESAEANHRPVQEGFASLNSGFCHACGHDGHAAIGLGLARALASICNDLQHAVRIIFQPAEEGVRGAAPLVGLAQGVQYFVTAHIGVNAAHNHELICGAKGFLATTKFDAEFFGTPAHAGAAPHKGKNALLAASCAALNMHAIPRHADGASRVSVGLLCAGTGRNVIPEHASMRCETRGETSEINTYMFSHAKNVIESAAQMYEQTCAVHVVGEAGSADSDPEMIEHVRTAARRVPHFRPSLIRTSSRGFGSDDACTFMRAVQKQGGKATYIMLGSQLAAGHHDARFDFDESVLMPALELLVHLTLVLDRQPA